MGRHVPINFSETRKSFEISLLNYRILTSVPQTLHVIPSSSCMAKLYQHTLQTDIYQLPYMVSKKHHYSGGTREGDVAFTPKIVEIV